MIRLYVLCGGQHFWRRASLPGVPSDGQTVYLPTGGTVMDAPECASFTVESVTWDVDDGAADVYLNPSASVDDGRLEAVLDHNGFQPWIPASS